MNQTTMTTDTAREFAGTFRATAIDYFCGSLNAPEMATCQIDMITGVIDNLLETHAGQYPALMRVVAHYAATSTDEDKMRVVASITERGGVCRLLDYVLSNTDTLGLWSHFLGWLYDAIHEAAKEAADE